MKIQVKQSGYTEDIPVIVNDLCNHAGAEVEVVTFAKDSWFEDAGVYANDDSEDVEVPVCQNCQSYLDDNGLWEFLI